MHPFDTLADKSVSVDLPHDSFFNALVIKEYNRLLKTNHTYWYRVLAGA